MVPHSKTHLGLSESASTQVKPDKRVLREHDSLARQPSVGSTRLVEVAAVVYACDVYVCSVCVRVCLGVYQHVSRCAIQRNRSFKVCVCGVQTNWCAREGA